MFDSLICIYVLAGFGILLGIMFVRRAVDRLITY